MKQCASLVCFADQAGANVERQWGYETMLRALFTNVKPIIGMVHLKPLPGSPLYRPGSMDQVCAVAVEEALILQEGGVDGIQVENIWDYPYLKCEEIGHETVAALTAAAIKVKEAVEIPIGINCHLNGVLQSIAVATAVGAKWVRVFEWTNAYISHAGYIEGAGGKAMRYKNAIGAHEIRFFCDVHVKHGSHFIVSDRSIEERARDAELNGADAIVISGWETGAPPDLNLVRTVKEKVTVPVILGSGVNEKNVTELLAVADAAIVGSHFKSDGNWRSPVDRDRVRRFMKLVRRLSAEL